MTTYAPGQKQPVGGCHWKRLGNCHLKTFWLEYGGSARTRTRDTGHYGLAYLSGLLRMKSKPQQAALAAGVDDG